MRLKTNHWLAIGVVALSVLWLASGALFHSHDGEADERMEAPTLRVVADTLSYRDVAGGAVISGRTQANYATLAQARAMGIVIALPVAEGATVRRGQIIARLSDEARTEAVTEAQARLDQARAAYDAAAALADDGFYPRLELDQRRAEQAAAAAGLDRARAEAARSVIEAPVDGVLDELLVDPGQAVQVGADVARIVDLDPIVAAAGVSDAERGSARVGDAASVHLQDGREVDGTVRFIAAAADAQTATYRIEVEIPNPDGAILSGQIADIRLAGVGARAAQVVRSALTLDDSGQLGVKHVDADGRVVFAPVTIVQDTPEGVWVSGPPENARVIVRGQEYAMTGAEVEIVDAADLAGAAQ